jgi:hypothetical protein
MAFQGYFELNFTTATNKDWKWQMKPDKYNEIITDSFAYRLFGFRLLDYKRQIFLLLRYFLLP